MAYPVVAAPYAMALPPAGGVAYAGGAGGVNDGAAMLMPRVARGSWSDGLFDCFDSFTITLLACCITPYRWALTEERSHQALHHAPREGLFTKSLLWYGIPWALVFLLQVIWDATGAWWLVFLCLLCTVIQIWLGMRTRKRLREQYGIQGSECEDCMLHAFCRCCAVAQEARHVDRDLAIPI
jgi:Cys-rich protein (TIGR01571 family)